MPDGHTEPNHASDQQRQAKRDRNRKALSQALRVHLLLLFIAHHDPVSDGSKGRNCGRAMIIARSFL
jgi:hypothetical protein